MMQYIAKQVTGLLLAFPLAKASSHENKSKNSMQASHCSYRIKC